MAANDNYNKVYVSGELVAENVYSHEYYGEKFYKSKIAIMRHSGVTDTIPVLISERIMPKDWGVGKVIHALGQIRTINRIIAGRSHLDVYIFVRDLLNEPASKNPNRVVLTGYICKQPLYRTTPLYREIADLLVAVNRSYGKSDYVPVIAWGRSARFASDLSVGDCVTLQGRIQSREYKKVLPDEIVETRTAYEVSVAKIMTAVDGAVVELWGED